MSRRRRRRFSSGPSRTRIAERCGSENPIEQVTAYRVSRVEATLYTMRISHPARAAELMLAHKGIEAERVEIPLGSQRVMMRRHGFRGGTVPGLKLDGKRVLGTREIARAVEEAQPEPPLYPSDRQT